MREPGFYWVRGKGDEDWVVAHFDEDGRWWWSGYEVEDSEAEMQAQCEIDERRIERA